MRTSTSGQHRAREALRRVWISSATASLTGAELSRLVSSCSPGGAAVVFCAMVKPALPFRWHALHVARQATTIAAASSRLGLVHSATSSAQF